MVSPRRGNSMTRPQRAAEACPDPWPPARTTRRGNQGSKPRLTKNPAGHGISDAESTRPLGIQRAGNRGKKQNGLNSPTMEQPQGCRRENAVSNPSRITRLVRQAAVGMDYARLSAEFNVMIASVHTMARGWWKKL